MGIRVLGNNVLIAEVEKEETTAGGIAAVAMPLFKEPIKRTSKKKKKKKNA